MPDTGDVDALREVAYQHFDEAETDMGRCYLEADVLHMLAEVRRETAEQIAQAIEAMRSFAHGRNPLSEAHLIGYGTARRLAARIAREDGTR